MRIVKEVSLPNGSDYFIRSNSNSYIDAYVLDSGKVVKYTSKTDNGSFNGMSWEKIDWGTTSSGITGIQGAPFEETSIIILMGDDATEAIKDPDDTELYDYRTPYRLYYAVDEDMVYQNIGGKWMPVATKDHNNLENKGKYTHEQIDNFIDSGGSQNPKIAEMYADVIKLRNILEAITFTSLDAMPSVTLKMPEDEIIDILDKEIEKLKVLVASITTS